VGGKLFYNFARSWMLFPLVLLATVAMVIASQALISAILLRATEI
jgi:K+ transporter